MYSYCEVARRLLVVDVDADADADAEHFFFLQVLLLARFARAYQ